MVCCAFYKGPIGQKLLEKTPELTQRSLQVTQAKLVDLQPRLQELMANFVRDYVATAKPPARGSQGSKPAAAAKTPSTH